MFRVFAARGIVSAAVALAACRSEFVVGEIVNDGTTTTETSTGTTVEPTTTTGTDAQTGTDASTTVEPSSSSGTSTGAEVCAAPSGHVPCDADVMQAADDPKHARVAMRVLGLDCTGEPENETPVVDAEFFWSDFTTWTTPGAYGNAQWSASEGDRLLVLTTGRLEHTQSAGTVTVTEGDTEGPGGANGNEDQVAMLPTPIVPQPGSAGGEGGTPFEDCDGVGDCSDTLPPVWSADADGADDMMWLRFSVDVPAGTHGYRVDLAWMSAEFPERVDAANNDIVVWWQSSEAFTGNLATLEGAALAVTPLREWLQTSGLVGEAPELVGTGYEGTTMMPCDFRWETFDDCPRGAATPWLTLAGPVVPEERVQIVLALFDLGDALVDTAVLVDRFRWDCEGCTPDGTDRDCGLVLR